MRYWISLLVVSLVVLLAACRQADTGPQPPDIAYGQDMCDECGMVIDQPKFAAATVLTTGESHKFDDIGEMVAYHMEHPDQTVEAWFVHDYYSEEWIRAETAYYIVSSELMTPMSFGVAALANAAEAAKLGQELGANVLTFDEMRLAVHIKAHG